MASFDVAYNWMMDNEDSRRQYANLPDAPPGAFAISGINSHAFPADFMHISAISQDQRGIYVQAFYRLHFWSTWFDQLTSDDLAKRVFDAAVNMGAGTAVKLLQMALGASIAQDGAWGPATLQAANSANPDALVTAFKNARVSYYNQIVARNPADQKYLTGWTARAGK